MRISDRPCAAVPEHQHDWPILSLYVMGGHRKMHAGGDALIARPAAVLHPAGVAHANVVTEVGLEQVDIEFDPDWLMRGASSLLGASVRCWVGGPVARASRALATEWSGFDRTDDELRRSTAHFLNLAIYAPVANPPGWLDQALALVGVADPDPTTAEIARSLSLNPAWFAQAYRAATGEGVAETRRRRRVERAVLYLRDGVPAAEAATISGFCDQSHMIRGFREVLGRTPAQVQAETRQ